MAETAITLKIEDNVRGLYQVMPAGTTVDNVFTFTDQDGTIVKILDTKGTYNARLGGVVPGSDMTSKLNTILAHAGVYEVIFDSGDITISGTLTVPAGKRIRLTNNGRLVGAGTVNGGVYDADMRKTCFDGTITINPEAVSNTNGQLSIMWWGADPTQAVDSSPAVQRAIDCSIRNTDKINTVFCPRGIYKMDSGVLAARKLGTAYAFFTLNLIGETSWWQNSVGGTKFVFTHKNQFGFAYHLGKGGCIKNIYIQGQFTPPAVSGYDWYKLSVTEFNDVTCRDNAYSPYAGIVIDPFVNNDANEVSGSNWATEGYPGWESYYQGGTGSTNSGSTGIIIEDVFITNWDLCLVFSPNSFTSNAEQMRGRKIQFANCRAAVVNTQDQEKTNTFQHMGCWADVHTVFLKGKYGRGTPGVYHVSDVNVAGRVNQFISHTEGGYFASHFDRIFCESLGKFGTLTSNVGATVSNSEIGFAYPNSESGQWQQSNIHAGTAVIFKSCNIRYYGLLCPVVLTGQATYDGCTFEVMPFFGDSAAALSSSGTGAVSKLINCTVISNTNGAGECGSPGLVSTPIYMQGGNKYINPWGRKVLINAIDQEWNDYMQIVDYSQPYAQIVAGVHTLSLTNGAERRLTVPLTGNDKWLWGGGATKLAVSADGIGFVGMIDSVSDTEAIIKYATKEWVDGVARTFYVWHPINHHHFSGDVTNGSPTISNVQLGINWTGMNNYVGSVIESPNSVNTSTYGRWNIIIATNGTDQFTCLKNFYTTQVDNVFSTAKEVRFSNKNANGEFSSSNKFIKGDFIINNVAGTFGDRRIDICVKSGTRATGVFKTLYGSDQLSTVITGNYTLGKVDENVKANTSGGNIVITTPAKGYFATGIQNYGAFAKSVRVIKTTSDSNTVTINAYSGENISGKSSIVLTKQYDYVDILITNTGNFIIGTNVFGLVDGFNISGPSLYQSLRYVGGEWKNFSNTYDYIVTLDNADYTVQPQDYTVIIRNHTTGKTVTIDAASECNARMLRIVNAGTAALTTSQSMYFDDGTTVTSIAAGKAVDIHSDGAKWWIIALHSRT